MFKRIAYVFLAFAMLAIGACTFLGDQADKRLGEACTDDVRVQRADLLYDLLEARHGPEITQALAEPLHVMHESLRAGVSLDPAGDAYRLAFIGVASDILEKEGIEVIAGISFRGVIKKLRQLPSLASGINLIEAKVGIACANTSKDKLKASPPPKAREPG